MKHVNDLICSTCVVPRLSYFGGQNALTVALFTHHFKLVTAVGWAPAHQKLKFAMNNIDDFVCSGGREPTLQNLLAFFAKCGPL